MTVADTGTRTCSHCKRSQPFSAFSKNRTNKSGYQHQCKGCTKQYYATTYIANNKRAQARRQDFRCLVDEYKRSPCVDCGKSYPPYVMDLDHVRDNKIAAVSYMAGSTCHLEALIAEIEKCDLVCANCHRIRTFSRVGTEA